MSEPTVHVIDDDAAVRDALRLLLTTEGHDVVTHESAVEFLAGVDDSGTGCIVTDVRMPQVDGLQLLREARKTSRDTQFIVMTAYGTVENAVEAMREGAYDYLLKPVDVKRLRAVVVVDRDLAHEGQQLLARAGPQALAAQISCERYFGMRQRGQLAALQGLRPPVLPGGLHHVVDALLHIAQTVGIALKPVDQGRLHHHRGD